MPPLSHLYQRHFSDNNLTLCATVNASDGETVPLKACPGTVPLFCWFGADKVLLLTPGEKMVSVTRRSSCLLLLLTINLSVYPPLLIFILIRPAVSISVQTSPKVETTTVNNTNSSIFSNIGATPTILISSTSTSSSISSHESTLASSTMSDMDQTSPRDLFISSPLTPSKTFKSSESGNPVRSLQKCHLSKRTLYPTSFKKCQPHTTKVFPSSNSTFFPKSLPSYPSTQNASNELPSLQSTLSSPNAILPLTPKTWPLFIAKPSPIPIPNLTSPPETAALYQPGSLPPPPSLPDTTSPLFEHQPFFVTWNIPDRVYRLGLYPHVDLKSRKLYNGGIPQRGDLKASMLKAKADINYYIPFKTSLGLSVIDWEEWRPLWERNWGTKKIYQTLSVAHVKQQNESLTEEQATKIAKQQFQLAAKSFMSGMLALGRSIRPNYLWGFYLFPNCYNHGWEHPDYTGQCSEEVKRQNDELFWLWESSTALYPSAYLQVSLADNPKAALMVRNRIQEALRVSALPRPSATAPVLVYMRPVFVDQNRRFLSQEDLVSTIGESAAVGASGAVMWGASADFNDQESCEDLSSYLTSTLNPYITNVTLAAQLCSNFLCRGNGRCVRKNYNSGHYLHLNPENFNVLHVQNRYLVLGKPTLTDLKNFSKRFTCQCYEGLNCSPRTYRELSKALSFSVKQWLYHKAHTLTKTMLEETQQDSYTQDKRHFR
ncbi:hyaluronidase PH-20-like [Xyrichtys novacula]|uniref:Hyaluronidase n=1 Tax=Xyrichtys novacula TaxID=13765 RepID=A0AAV1F1T6_XYRNO|nr:hyaluronidase PH-20-like [Xyrichtys novacula]